jgi:hypothetical protein
MKNLFLVLFIILFSSGMSAQTWKRTIYGTAGNKGVRTIRIKPAASVTIRTLEIKTDSLNYSTTLAGTFKGAANDTLTLKLDNFSDLKILGSGKRFSTTIPGKLYLQPFSEDTGIVRVPVSRIDYLVYRNNPDGKLGEIGEGAVFTSLFVLIASPFLCINYSDGSFNAERYKYWALGSTAVMVVSFTAEGLFGGQRIFQFHPGWPINGKKVWSFSREGH